MTEQDILLDTDDDVLFDNGDLAIGDCLIQEVGIIVRINQGDLKSDPVMGPNLVRLIKSKANIREAQTAVKIALARDNKSYDDVKQYIGIGTK